MLHILQTRHLPPHLCPLQQPNLLNFSFSKYLSVLHYNIKSLRNKVDLIQSECSNFDIVALTESWLDTSIENDTISMKFFHPPVRKDRHYDYHGGVIVYVKESLYYKRRSDLESGNLECIWIEIILRNKRVLCGTFSRPPNSDST